MNSDQTCATGLKMTRTQGLHMGKMRARMGTVPRMKNWLKEPSSLTSEVEHPILEPCAMVPCPARATHGADLRAVCGCFHRNQLVCRHFEGQENRYGSRSL
jgi:hypothetical protein